MNSQMRVEQPATERDTEQESSSATLSRDDAYHLLQNGRRRAALRYMLAAEGEEFVMRDVTEAVAAWEHDTTVRQLTSDERQRVYISLYQAHLPKLADHDVVDYNQSRGVVTLRPLATVLAPLLGDGLEASQTIEVAGADAQDSESSDGLLARFGFAE